MKIHSLFLSALVLFAGIQAVSAQDGPVSIAYIDTDAVILRMPGLDDVRTELQAEQVEVDSIIAEQAAPKQDSLIQISQELDQASRGAVSDQASLEAMQQDLMRLQYELEGMRQQGLQYLAATEARLLQPLLNQVDEAIATVSERENIDLVLSTTANNAPVVLYHNQRVVDITTSVMEELGIDPDAEPQEPLPTVDGEGEVPVSGGGE